MIPQASDSEFWKGWEFNDGIGGIGRTYVKGSAASKYVLLNSAYSGLCGFITTYMVVSHARETTVLENVTGGVSQEVQLARIPIFQFAMYSSGDMEISCGQPLVVNGQVHANKTHIRRAGQCADVSNAVTAVTAILFQRTGRYARRSQRFGRLRITRSEEISRGGYDLADRHDQHPRIDP